MNQRPTLAMLEQRVAMLTQQVDSMTRILEALGIKVSWASPAQAAIALGVSADWIKDQIKDAEDLRANKKKPKLQHGTHYRDIASRDAITPTYHVHVANFGEWLKLPPDERW